MAAAREQFQVELDQVKAKIIDFADGVKGLLNESVEALYNSNVETAKQVIAYDEDLNRKDMEINDTAVLLIAKQQPVASDLRRLIVAIRIASDLERMGDNAKNIAKATLHLGEDHGLKIHETIGQMKEVAINMIDLSITAYEEEDITLAKKLSDLDDKIDEMYGFVLKDLLQETATNSEQIQHMMQMAFSGRYIERFGDHATNIGEHITYLVKGESPDLNQ